MGIPAKLNAHSEGKPNSIPGWPRTPSERSDAGTSIVLESVRLRQETPIPSAAEEERRQRGKGSGERGGSSCPRLSALKRPRSASAPNCIHILNTTRFMANYCSIDTVNSSEGGIWKATTQAACSRHEAGGDWDCKDCNISARRLICCRTPPVSQ
jgi:hypothetical protein